jgi:two-component system chemotaxis response regulator CheY
MTAMATNVLICDDSSFARKQMARAIPKEWEVDIHFAGDGVEGVQAIREGKGEVVFLDLTMPNMDGYGVLETIRKEDLPAMVIVVSGDIQPDAQDRVKKLGAMAFIKKPIDADKAREVLTEYGILTGA